MQEAFDAATTLVVMAPTCSVKNEFGGANDCPPEYPDRL